MAKVDVVKILVKSMLTYLTYVLLDFVFIFFNFLDLNILTIIFNNLSSLGLFKFMFKKISETD